MAASNAHGSIVLISRYQCQKTVTEQLGLDYTYHYLQHPFVVSDTAQFRQIVAMLDLLRQWHLIREQGVQLLDPVSHDTSSCKHVQCLQIVQPHHPRSEIANLFRVVITDSINWMEAVHDHCSIPTRKSVIGHLPSLSH